MITADVDASRAVSALESLSDALGVDASTLVRDETRRLCRTITNFVPPLKSSHGSPQVTGQHAVERELKNLFSEATPQLIDEVGSKYGIRDVNAAYVTERTGTHLNLQWGAIDPTGERMEEYHKEYRGTDGKIPIVRRNSNTVWASRVVVPTGSRDPYIQKVKARVGRWKATFALAGSKLADKYPNWIAKHFGSIADIASANVDGLNDKTKPVVVFSSSAPGNNRIRATIQAAVNFRAKVILRRVKLILSGYKQDIAKGIRAAARAHKTGNEPMPTVE